MNDISLFWLALGAIVFLWSGIIVFSRHDRYKLRQAQHELIAKLLSENLNLRKTSPVALADNLNDAASNGAGRAERNSPEFSLNQASLARITRFYRDATRFSRVRENVKNISDLLLVSFLTANMFPVILSPNLESYWTVYLEYLPWIAIPVVIIIVLPLFIEPISTMLRGALKDHLRTRLRREGYSYADLVQIRAWLDLQQAQAEGKHAWEVLTKLIDERLAELNGETATAPRSSFTKTQATPV